MRAQILNRLLIETNYNKEKRDFLGFTHGFDLGYRGPEQIQQTAKNLKFTIGNETELWNKVMKEVELKRYAGLFTTIPFDNYIQSPIGLVPKDEGTKTRLIFHLPYPRSGNGTSVNGVTPEDLTSVQYCSFDDTVRLCIKEGPGCAAAKSDMSSAFRHLPMKKIFWKFLVMKAKNPADGKFYYFVDKCMPFDIISHIMEFKMKRENINYSDDFFFTALRKLICDNQVKCVMDICNAINFPVSKEKTFWGSTQITFLGLLIDTVRQMVFTPIEKVHKAKELIEHLLHKKNNKTKLKSLQKLTGFLNFLGKSIVPGRTFTRRLYAYTKGVLKPHHHIYNK